MHMCQTKLARTKPPSAARGQALILIVFAIVGLVAITGLAVDGGNAFADRRRAQNAADSAAVAGALARINGQNWLERVKQVAASNGYSNSATTTVEVHSPPDSGTYKGNIEYIQIRIISHVRSYFAPVIGVREITNAVESVARSKPPVMGPLFGGAAVVALAPNSDCLFNKSFYVHAEATLAIWGNGIFINSANKTCALIQQGEGSLRINTGEDIKVVGGANIQKPQLLTPTRPITGSASIPYPPPVFWPKVGCGTKEATVSADGKEISTGNWGEDDFPPPGVNKLHSGNYCLDGDFVIPGARTLEGNGVVILMQHGRVRWSNAATIELTAPTKGDLAGLLLYQPMQNKNPLILNAAEGSKIRGTILAPAAQIKIKGNDSQYGFHGQLIGFSFDVDGNSNVVIRFEPDENYQALTLPEVQLVK